MSRRRSPSDRSRRVGSDASARVAARSSGTAAPFLNGGAPVGLDVDVQQAVPQQDESATRRARAGAAGTSPQTETSSAPASSEGDPDYEARHSGRQGRSAGQW
jgi:hypothetical protein